MFHGTRYVASRPRGLRSAVGLLTLLGGAVAAAPAMATPNDILTVFGTSPLMPEAPITLYVLVDQTAATIAPTGSVSVTPAGGSADVLSLTPLLGGSSFQSAATFQFPGYAAIGGHDFSISYGGGDGLDALSTTYTANVEFLPVAAPVGTEQLLGNSGNLNLVVNLGNSGANGKATVIDLTDNVIEQNVPVTGGVSSVEIDGVPPGPKELLEEFGGQTTQLQVDAVPEPGTLPLAAVGLFALALVRRKTSVSVPSGTLR